MEKTVLYYLNHNNLLFDHAKVLNIVQEDGKDAVILDRTILYPKGGGQPYDKGIIKNASGKFIVNEVRFCEGTVKHYGMFETGEFNRGEKVNVSVDETHRLLNSRIHTAGHLIDFIIAKMGDDLTPSNGYHYPDGPYVEYIGQLDTNKIDSIKLQLEKEYNQVTKAGMAVTFRFVRIDEDKKFCSFVPNSVPQDKPLHLVFFGDWASPCGGTHVNNLKEIGKIIIRKIKINGNIIRISYALNG